VRWSNSLQSRDQRERFEIRNVAAIALIGFALSISCAAGPVEFGLAEYNAAVASRSLKWKVTYDVNLEPAETYRIEPFAYGGAHVSGGDLRGLMYGLLDAADQVRATGRIKLTHSVPSTSIRALRRFSRDGLGNDVSDWRSYFEMLARDRFNRFTLIYTEPPALDQNGLEKLRAISQLAADYAVDFTLALWYAPASPEEDSLEKIIAACPLIRTIQIRTTSHDLDAYRAHVFKPLHNAGRRIALDPDPEIASAAQQDGIAVRADPLAAAVGWPPNFEIEAPADFETHAEFYWLWGRLSYDPKSKPVHSEDADEFHAAGEIVAALATSKAPPSDWIASAGEAIANRVNNVASAKRTPLDLADWLASEAAELAGSQVPDLQLLATLARGEATRLRDAFDAEVAKAGLANAGPLANTAPLPPPQFTHTVVHTAPPDQPINLTLQIAPTKDARLVDLRVVRLHYRALDSSTTTVMEKPAAASVSFTIPLAPSDLLYYFEILRANSGWFEPDPAIATPYHVIRIEPKQPQ
jgi:hypothetical protein